MIKEVCGLGKFCLVSRGNGSPDPKLGLLFPLEICWTKFKGQDQDVT